jgi:hypothetical protein
LAKDLGETAHLGILDDYNVLRLGSGHGKVLIIHL